VCVCVCVCACVCVCVNFDPLMAHMLSKRGRKYWNHLGYYVISSDYSSQYFEERFLSYLQRKPARLGMFYPANKDCHSSKLRELCIYPATQLHVWQNFSLPSTLLWQPCMCHVFEIHAPLVNTSVIRRVRKIAKSDYHFCHACPSFCLSVCLPVCPSAWNNSAPTGRISMKFNTWELF
jgi:hypothetical protein